MLLLSYNIASRTAPWQLIMESDVDMALVQEISRPPQDVFERIVVRTSERKHVEWVRPHIVSESLAALTDIHALNAVDVWGPSDQCRVKIEVRQ